MSDVFLSYHRNDSDFATVLRIRLEKSELTVWVDTSELRAGDHWRDEIDRAILAARVLLLVVTPESCSSQYVTYEWAFALGAGIKVIPILLRAAEFHARLEALQYLDFTSHTVRPWDVLVAQVKQVGPRPDASRAEDGRQSAGITDMAVRALDSTSREERLEAIQVLAQSTEAGAQEALLKALNHPLRDVRVAAGAALAEAHPDAAVNSLLEGMAYPMMGDGLESKLGWESYHALVAIGASALPQLMAGALAARNLP